MTAKYFSSAAAVSVSLLALAPGLASATSYNYAMEYSGKSFFDGWTFFNNHDNVTHGAVTYVSAQSASSDNLAYVNNAGNAIIKVDNTSRISFGDNRKSVRITSNDRFAVGSVWIADFLHVPFGCSTWPAFWSVAPSWPSGGEIDTFEGVNGVKNNQMTLHTEPGCKQINANQTSKMVDSTDCNYQLNGNQGCVTVDPNPSSYGQAFADAGGGIFVTEYSESGVSIWFFNRSSIPSSLSGSNVSSFDTNILGTPVANYPNGGCDMSTYFGPQNLVFDISLCGDLAGAKNIFQQTCPGDCYIDWVTGDPSNYDNAYFEVKSIKIFGSGTSSEANILQVSSSEQRVHSVKSWFSAVLAVLASFVGLPFMF